MNYPFWDVDLGYGVLMAVIAVVHVFVAHFAIGGGLYLVVAETAARRKNDADRLQFLRKLSKFFVLVSVVFGALTGVGIWFIIGLLNPAGTEVLIHNFVWGWATEWTFFLIEVCAALLYFYGWQRLSARNHLIIGWIYFVAAWLSLVVINGIVTFMLTPGKWIQTGDFWDGFFNPTYWPSLALRTGICIMLAGLYSLLVAARYRPSEFKARIVRYNAVWAMAGLVITLPTFLWYLTAIPATVMAAVAERMPTPMLAMWQMYVYTGVLAIVIILFGLALPKAYHTVIGVIAMLAGLLWFGSFEWFRESARKPYVIYGYMYGNGVELAQSDRYTQDGYLAHIEFRTGDDGADLFRRACRSCHTVDGYKALKPAFDGTDEEFIAGVIKGLHVTKGNMPQFVGSNEEIGLLAAHIHDRTDRRHLKDIYNLSGVELGRKVYDVRCGTCHQFGGYNDKAASLLGLSDQGYEDLLDMAGDIADEMPPFTGDSVEREALITYLKSLGEGGAR
ncbi:MAG TPA: cytochrome ubiquinol oxidase subunit I [Candidatus Deferrimicrobium sp.]|nr:cytochrome ubiquinol oxidase subunit I [Candidatus Deferrimicrobium sp.]